MVRDRDAELSRLALLAEPARRRLYELVVRDGGWVSRESAATQTGISRGLVAFHLDKLAAAGLLEVERRRAPGRAGPGAGRPAKLYRRLQGDVAVSVPPRQYDVMGRILLRARHGDAGEAARSVGRELGDAAGAAPLTAVLSDLGFTPTAEDGQIGFANCPFHELAGEDRDTVCALNLDFVRGIVERCGHGVEAVAAESGGCCVALRPSR